MIYISVRTPLGWHSAVVGASYDDLIRTLRKVPEWSEVARRERMEVSKSLGDFFDRVYSNAQGIELNFVSERSGQETGVSMVIVDFTTSARMTLYMDVRQTLRLLRVLEGVPATYEVLKREVEKSDLLK
jgi:hypothetical protein